MVLDRRKGVMLDTLLLVQEYDGAGNLDNNDKHHSLVCRQALLE